MLNLNLSNENIREAFLCDDADIASASELLFKEIRGLEYERCYTQSKGAFVIVQAGTPEEIEAFDAALDRAKAAFSAVTA